MCGTDCFLMLLSVLFPPIGVWVKRGICSADSVINIALCVLGVLPGLLHSWYIILKYPESYPYEPVPDGERDGHVTYYYVARGGPAPRAHPRAQQQQPRGPVYGTMGSQPAGGQFPGQQSGGANAFPAPKTGGQGGERVYRQEGVQGQEVGGSSSNGEGSQPNGPPPTYAEVIKGDNKVQDQGQ
ncbi:hypothetical protein EJ04DRAFT_509239 [Polyplosphaeria fusca]|uniref:Uncharacterized protein n=1 Tax=Polyplosphaeria fusca TaxID=682080 RepID=A0A9P4V7A2_9PLEO|nr:hypothetical protein EJ04DRAFT_509239 [Polyplosphaeria fusca]